MIACQNLWRTRPSLQVAALAAGQISEKEMPSPNGASGVRDSYLRYAPSFITAESDPGGDIPPGRLYTALSLGKFLGMTDSGGNGKVTRSKRLSIALNALALEEEGYLKRPERSKWKMNPNRVAAELV
jgi:hypothetical protein